VSTDTNDDGKVSAFNAYAEWPTLIFKGGQVGDLGAQVLPDETVVEDADVAELLASKEAFESYVPEDPDPGGDPGGGDPGGGDPPGGPGGPGGNVPAPALSGLSIRPSAFQAAPRGGSIAARRGAKVRYTLTAAASVRLRVEKLVSGRRRGGKCVAPKRAPRGRTCLRAVPVRGSFQHAGQAGANSFGFTGRLRGRTLRPGRYQLTATPVGASGAAGSPKSAQFRVLSPRR
jgi:hypothetical protein